MTWIFQFPGEEEKEDAGNEYSSSTTSSIGKNSDLWESNASDSESDGDGCKEENEVQSQFKPTDGLEEALPIRRGISKFYEGRSKSFMCLTNMSSYSSVKDIGKAEDIYTKQRRNELAHHIWTKNSSFPRLSDRSKISKKPLSSTNSTLALRKIKALKKSESIGSTNSNIIFDKSISRSGSVVSANSNSSQSPNLPESLHLHSLGSHNDIRSLLFIQKNVPLRNSFSSPALQHAYSNTL